MRDYKVALVAMSGVRIQNPELLSLGLTLPGFVERSEVIASLPSLSLLTLAAHCPPQWIADYFEIDAPDPLLEVKLTDYDLIAISSFTARIEDAYALSDRLRTQGLKVVLGGLHVSALPFEAQGHADAVVQGEAESVWPLLLKDFEDGKLKPFYRALPVKFENSPTPRYDLLDIRKYNRLTLQTTRGCPLHCHFCAASRTLSPYKLKPLEQIERELESILKIWDRPFIELADDNTFVNKAWSRQLARLFAEHSIKWFTETDISLADDPELLELLAESNCTQVLIGLESAIPDSLVGMDRNDWKRKQFDRYVEAIHCIQSYGVSVNGCFILGLDSDDENVFELTNQFVQTSGLSEVQLTLLTPFPGTDLYHQLHREGRLLKEKFWNECTLFDVTYEPALMSTESLELGFRKLMQETYSPEQVLNRKRIFKQCRQARGENRENIA